MITGYNTDVRHREVVFHVQTEDKGMANPYIESLVYVGGQVLASKRASYAAMLAEGKDEKDIVAMMDLQHRTMIAAIRHGKLDEKLAALTQGRATGHHPVVTAAPSGPQAAAHATGQVQAPAAAVAPPPPVLSAAPPIEPAAASPLPPLPPRPAAASERTLDQVILEYLTSEADQEQLVLALDGDAGNELRLGQFASLVLRTTSSKSGQPVPGAQISARMISTVTEPKVLASGKTGADGALTLAFEIPPLSRGTAALIITAISSIGRAELKHLL